MEVWTQDQVWGMLQNPKSLIIPVLFALGIILKRTGKFPDWAIPVTLVVVGAVLGFAVIGGGAGLLAGIALSLIPIGAHQTVKQTNDKT